MDFLEAEVPIPVYFAYETEHLIDLYDKITASVTSDAATSALKGMLCSELTMPS